MRNNRTFFARIAAAAFLAAAAFAAGTQGASAFQLQDEAADQSPAVLAYADPMEGRFGPAPDEESYADHELNDAWLGMSVRASDGQVLGYVVDALIDNDGNVSEIVVASSPDSDVQVFIPAELATLTDDDVELALSRSDVAAIRSAYEAVLASN